MNWLAHLLIAADAGPGRLAGNLAGDFMRGTSLERLDPALRRGVEDHRAVDRFTDAHPDVRAARELVRPTLGRYAEVALDVWFDHVLARDWHRWRAHEPLAAFQDRVGDTLTALHDRLPARLASLAPRIRDGRWLESYADYSGIDAALRGIARRARRQPNPLGTAGPALAAHDTELARRFEAFFPELQAFAARRLGS